MVSTSLGADGLGIVAVGKADDAVGLADEIPGALDELLFLVAQVHVDVDVAGMELALRLDLLAALHFGNALGRDDDFADQVAHLLGLGAALEAFLHLLFLAGKNVQGVPLRRQLG